MNHARNHYLRVLAEKSAKADAFGATRQDASVYLLQLAELKNDKSLLSHIKSDESRAEAKAKLIPKYLPYVEGILAANQKVEDEIVTTIMLWCLDAGMFDLGLKIAVFALAHGLDMPDSFSRDTPSIVAEEIANAALSKLKAGDVFDLNILLQAEQLTESYDLHDPIRAKLYCAIGKIFLSVENYVPAIEYMKKAIAKKDNVGCKQDLDRAEKLLAKQLEEQQAAASS
ncbi:phage terminase small subunit [Acinetobacter sp. ANC 4178]|uniref:phage terminase small subunit n=1 Tax=Acinetobacter sp. ANC 4178 TaxID=2529839 RepID=UPI0010402FB3|nr:phage terminase small subunit [Acinetobacter sp. ANC 4178]TCB68660.1 terminase [Acinetobacter sp. ANC 4178]